MQAHKQKMKKKHGKYKKCYAHGRRIRKEAAKNEASR
jgi:hypothetical protein